MIIIMLLFYSNDDNQYDMNIHSISNNGRNNDNNHDKKNDNDDENIKNNETDIGKYKYIIIILFL